MNFWYVVLPAFAFIVLTGAVLLALLVPRILAKPQCVADTPPPPVIPLVEETAPDDQSVRGTMDDQDTDANKQLWNAGPSPWTSTIRAPKPPPQTGYCHACPWCPECAPQVPEKASPVRTTSGPGPFSCDYYTGQCVPDPDGTLDTCDACEKRTYYCNPDTWTCTDVGVLRDSAAECRRRCYPDLRVHSTNGYAAQRFDTNANGSGAFCAQGKYRKATSSLVYGTNVPAYEWVDMSCVGYRCCQSHYCDSSGIGQDPYSVSVCGGIGTESACTAAVNAEVPAYCEWTGSACQATAGKTSACAACTSDSQCPGKYGAFKCVAGACVAQGRPMCDVVHSEYKTDEVVSVTMMKACKQLFSKDKDTVTRLCKNVSDGDACAGTFFERSCVDRFGKTWVTERSHCGARSAPEYPTVDDD